MLTFLYFTYPVNIQTYFILFLKKYVFVQMMSMSLYMFTRKRDYSFQL